MEKKQETIDRIIEYGIYAYIFFMFLAKGEGIRNMLIFGTFGLWLITLKYRRDLYILNNNVSRLCWIYVAAIVISAVFSMDPSFSLKELKDEPLKFVFLFPVIATVMSDEKRLVRTAYVSLAALLLIVFAGYYSYIFHDIPMLKPDTAWVHAWHTKFAAYVNTYLPLACILFFVWNKTGPKINLAASAIISVIALILSTSRGGYLAFFVILIVWLLYLSKKKGHNMKVAVAALMSILLIFGAASYMFSPRVRERISQTPEEIYTANARTDLWRAALYAFKERPLTGWGYGANIYMRDEPYRDTPYKKAPQTEKDQHNMFIKIMFHEGIVGIVPFVLLIMAAIRGFWKEAFSSTGVKSYMLIACASIFIGNYVVQAMLETLFKLQYIAVVLGLGMAARGINENRGT
ncbi:MAG: O-antigen ligase domain-containing protein [Nitrospiraceae bacterium]|nr:MAG: O-antigen ligase domain-containing protein [Nitrospiraceae bacterium]